MALLTLRATLERVPLPITAIVFIGWTAAIILIPRFFFWQFSDLVLDETTITYFGKKVAYDKIVKLNISVSSVLAHGRAAATVTFVVLEAYSAQPDVPVLSIDIKPYSKKDITLLLKTIMDQTPRVQTDQFIQEVISGNFRGLREETAKQLHLTKTLVMLVVGIATFLLLLFLVMSIAILLIRR